MSRPVRQPGVRTTTIGLAIGLIGGAADVCIALLNKPRGFEALTPVFSALLAAAVVVFVVYAAMWATFRLATAMWSLDNAAASIAVAAAVTNAVTLALLSGLHARPLSPQALFVAGMIGVLSLLFGVGAYAWTVAMRARGWNAAIESAVAAAPLLAVELLLWQWVEVYVVDRAASPSSFAATAVFAGVAGATAMAARPMTRRWPAAAILVVFTAAIAAMPAADAVAARKPNGLQARGLASSHQPRRIILITVDTLRADAVSTYRPAAPRTPAIDRLAADGVVFERALAPSPWTLPSLTSILTGLVPAAHHATTFTSTVSRNVTTLAEFAGESGYRTAAILHNDLLDAKSGLAQGFDEYQTLEEPYFAHSLGMTALQLAAPGRFPPSSWPSNDDETRLVVEWLESNRDRDFFLWVHYLDPHAPYAPPREYRTAPPTPTIGASFEGQKLASQGFFVPGPEERQAIRSLYDGEVRWIDACIARIVSTLERLRLYDDALIVFTSDHGEEFWEHGGLGHGHSMYDELLRVPLIIKLPGAAVRGRRDAMVSTASVTPTILDAARISYEPRAMSVSSLMPLVDPARGTFQERPIVSDAQILFDRRQAVFFERFKYVVSAVDGREQLFDLEADPGELHPLATAAPLETGRRLLQTELTSATALRKRIRVDAGTGVADEDTLRRLRSLGYLR